MRAERISEAIRNKWQEPEYQARQHQGHLGIRPGGVQAQGFYVSKQGYFVLTGLWDHLLSTGGKVHRARMVLYEQLGPGPHECHWNWFSRCGSVALHWGGTDGVQVDHLDGDKLNDDPRNLVPSCLNCNRRGIRLVVDRGGLYLNNTSGVTGVSWDKKTRKWKARASGDRWLGRFGSLELAAAAVTAAENPSGPQ